MRVGIIFGTRPEVIKIAPIYYYFKSKGEEVFLISTGQHESMLKEALTSFKLLPDIELHITRVDNSLNELTSQLIDKISLPLKNMNLDMILVQGDTTTTFIGALVGFYNKLPVAHIEAGLRTDNIYAPFPEEINRKLVTQIATLHFAPTKQAVINLLKDGVDKKNIIITGNTIVDAIHLNLSINNSTIEYIEKKHHLKDKKYILLTMHRRESIPNGVISVLTGIKTFCEKHPDIKVIYPVHLNSKLREITVDIADKWEGIEFIEPLNYYEISAYMKNAMFIMTDSGGIQEEAPTYNKYTLILRNETEREEIVEEELGKLIGTDSDTIYYQMETLLKNYFYSGQMKNPYGDGDASEKIYKAIQKYINTTT